MASKKHPLTEKTQVILTPGGPAGSFVRPELLRLGHLQGRKHADLCEDLIRWVEDEKRFEEYMQASIGQAGPVYKSRVENPYWKSDPNFDGMLQNMLRSTWLGYPGPITPAAVEVQAQYILCDMAGRVVVGGLSPEAALQEAHKRIEDIHKIRNRGLRREASGGSTRSSARDEGVAGRPAAGGRRSRASSGPTTGSATSSSPPSPSPCWRWWPIPSATRSISSLTHKLRRDAADLRGARELHPPLRATASSSRAVYNSFLFTFGSVGFKLVLGMLMALVLMSKIRFRSFWTGVLLDPVGGAHAWSPR